MTEIWAIKNVTKYKCIKGTKYGKVTKFASKTN